MGLLTPGTGIIHTMTFKYASALLQTELFAKNEVFTLDPERAGNTFRSSIGTRFAFGIVVMSDDPVLDLTIGHELGHDALERIYKKGAMGRRERNLCEETFCDFCGLEYWMFKNQTMLTNTLFKSLLRNEILYAKNTKFALKMAKDEIKKDLNERRLRLVRAWEWLQYAIKLEKEGKISEPKLNEHDESEEDVKLKKLNEIFERYLIKSS